MNSTVYADKYDKGNSHFLGYPAIKISVLKIFSCAGAEGDLVIFSVPIF